MPENRRLLPMLDRSLTYADAALVALLNGLAIGNKPWPLLLHGRPGRGKTCGVLALCDIVETACYWTAERLGTFIMGHNSAEVEGEYDRIGSKHLAVLDELGERERTGDLGYQAVKQFADVREQRAGRVAIYISNVPPHELADVYDDRLASRILCGTIHELTGDDRRKVRA